MPISKAKLKRFANLCNEQGSCSYNEENKIRFHREAKSVCRELVARMGLEKSQYKIRSNMGGIAVSGEVTLHTDGVYFQLSQSACGCEVMYRKCNGQKDFTGGRNRWLKYNELCDLKKVATILRVVHDGANDQMIDFTLRTLRNHGGL